MSFEIKFSFLNRVANLSLVPILNPIWRRLVKIFETVAPPSKRMERQTTLHKSLSPKRKSLESQ